MKKAFFYTLLASLLLFINCSKDEDDKATSPNLTKQKLIGKWYFADPAIYGYSTNNSFTFTSDGKVTYTYWTGTASDFDSETGPYSVEGDKLTMIYPENTVLTFVQKVVFVTDTKVNFEATGNPNEEPYDGTYYKEN